MKTRNLLAGVAGAAAGAIAAGKYLEYYRPGPLPGPDELNGYFDALFEMMGVPGLRHEIEEDWIECDGLKLHLDIFAADGAKPTLVFVPGTSVYARFYAEFMHKMRLLGFNVVGFDPRGHGMSEGRRGSYTIETLLRDTEAVVTWAMDRFGDGVALSGSSQGGITAFYAAGRDERLKAVVCHNIAVLGEPEAFSISRWPRFSALFAKMLPMAAITPELRIPISTYLDLSAEPTRFGRDALEFVKEDPLAVLAIATKAMASLASTPPPRPIEEITTPILVIQGELDAMFTEFYTRRIYDRLTCEREFVLVAGATHLVLTNNVDAVVPEVAAFLTRYM
ncbi:MAG TPA: alpha/beta hydrolase [Candidatus Anoxymicrobiaceae bacterium]|jgi:pimeloyl-ACP methyl ester carboxylesterase